MPRELERICLKCLEKRAQERYTTAVDLAEDLRQFLQSPLAGLTGAVSPPAGVKSSAAGRVYESAAHRITGDFETKFVPKGLRPFDEEDADIFLQFLPGPRDRDGLPDSIRFWKRRVEQTDPDKTFAVGLMYGPSGCGKSSLLKAGLLPRLSAYVTPVYAEATRGLTEQRLHRALCKTCPGLEQHLSLPELLARMRRGQGPTAGGKILIVLDQFEQWLQTVRQEQDTTLVEALRQCDGARLQCIVMVRDDFWMAVTRFMQALEIQLLEGLNSHAVDLLPADHARHVLETLGRAYGAITDKDKQDHGAFLDEAIGSLAEDSQVVCVRLSLFAEMMKNRPWTLAALRSIGGAAGVGESFLEQMLGSVSAPPELRPHQAATRKILKLLLPPVGTDIRDTICSREQLLVASGYAARAPELDELIDILDHQLRLITPTEPECLVADEVARTNQGSDDNRWYQLTHDYLVPSIRNWLTRKQQESRRGRAELRLAECVRYWSRQPESRFLPGPGDALGIWLFSRRSQWTKPEQRMMCQAGVYYGVRAGLVLLLFCLLAVAAVSVRRTRAREQLAKQQALENLQQAREAVDTWLTGPFDDLSQLPGVQDFLVRLLRKAEQDYEKFARSGPSDVSLELERGRIQLRLGQVFQRQEDLTRADEAYRKARDILARLRDVRPASHDVQAELANAQVSLGHLQLLNGNTQDADSLLAAAIELLNDLMATSDAPRLYHLRGMAGLFRSQLPRAPPADTEATLRTAVADFLIAYDRDPDEAEYLRGLSTAWQVLGKRLQDQGRIDEAETVYDRAIAEVTESIQAESAGALAYELRADARLYLAGLYRSQCDRSQEGEAYRQAAADYLRLVRVWPELNRYRRLQAVATVNYGQWLHRMGDTQSAKQQLLAAQSTLTDLLKDHPQLPRYRELLAICLDLLGQVHLDLLESAEGQAVLKRAVDYLTILSAEQTDQLSYVERRAITASHLATSDGTDRATSCGGSVVYGGCPGTGESDQRRAYASTISRRIGKRLCALGRDARRRASERSLRPCRRTVGECGRRPGLSRATVQLRLVPADLS